MSGPNKFAAVKRKPYICHACRGGLHSLCASDTNSDHVCTCDEMWHVDTSGGVLRKFKGTTWIPAREEKP